MDAIENAWMNKSKIRDKMIEIAQQEIPITYTDLFSPYGLNTLEHYHTMNGILGKIGEEEDEQLPMLTAVVIRKDDWFPGVGFYELAIRLGKLSKNAPDKEKEKFWIEELKKVYDYYGQKQKP